MSAIGRTGFTLFLILVFATAAVFCLPYHYGWSWGVAIQLWALFGFMKLYHLSEPARADAPHKKLSVRLRDSLFRRSARESDAVTGRMEQMDACVMMLSGALMVLCVLYSAYDGFSGEASVSQAMYATLYLVAQIFCFGVIAFLAQLYAASPRFVLAGFFLCMGLAVTVMAYALARYGLAVPDWAITAGQGTSLYLAMPDTLSPFMLRLAAMGWAGAVLPWVVMGSAAYGLVRVILNPARQKMVPVLAVLLVVALGFYDLFAVRGHFHFLIVLPAFTAVMLAWARSGYGSLWTPFPGFAARRTVNLLPRS